MLPLHTKLLLRHTGTEDAKLLKINNYPVVRKRKLTAVVADFSP